jgi:hypothetical protein
MFSYICCKGILGHGMQIDSKMLDPDPYIRKIGSAILEIKPNSMVEASKQKFMSLTVVLDLHDVIENFRFVLADFFLV